METILLVLYFMILRSLLVLFAKNSPIVITTHWLVVFLLSCFVSIAAPMVALKNGLLPSSVSNMALAGGAFFYFPWVVSSILRKMVRK